MRIRRIIEWFRPREQRRWDEQSDADSSAGKLDSLFDEAEGESEKGLLREWLSHHPSLRFWRLRYPRAD